MSSFPPPIPPESGSTSDRGLGPRRDALVAACFLVPVIGSNAQKDPSVAVSRRRQCRPPSAPLPDPSPPTTSPILSVYHKPDNVAAALGPLDSMPSSRNVPLMAPHAPRGGWGEGRETKCRDLFRLICPRRITVSSWPSSIVRVSLPLRLSGATSFLVANDPSPFPHCRNRHGLFFFLLSNSLYLLLRPPSYKLAHVLPRRTNMANVGRLLGRGGP
ncbi:hypothetical protein LZ30DRAFT_352346 [Colletotrichum cereale]|nr:hypothetical protein LZ30DRAFT_352346 [Colletotrichum cereale]